MITSSHLVTNDHRIVEDHRRKAIWATSFFDYSLILVQNKSTKVIDRGYDDNMAAKLSSFPPHPLILSPLFKKAPDAMPPTEELVQLQKELEAAKEKALERSKKANDDLKTIEESIRRMTEREKGKFKPIDKIKRERDCTYMLPINDFSIKKSDIWTCICIS